MLFLCGVFYKCQFDLVVDVLFSFSVALLIFNLVVLSVAEKGLL